MSQPFEFIPQTPEIASLERETQQYLGLLFGPWLEIYRPSGPLPRERLEQAIASAVGTLMLRLADMGVSTLQIECPAVAHEQAMGDMALHLARVAGFVASQAPPRVRLHLQRHLVEQLTLALDAPGQGPEPASARPPVPAPAGLPMTPIRTAACNMTLVADGCYDLPARRDEDGFATYWQPDDESKAAIAAGLPIKLSIVGHSHPPVRLEVDAL